jgi:hypothetical protein
VKRLSHASHPELARGGAVAAVAKARMPFRYVKFERSEVPGPDLDAFVADAGRFDIVQTADGHPLDDWAAAMRKRGE